MSGRSAFLDRALVFGGVGVLGVGLLVLTVLLIRGAPAGQEETDAEAVTAGEDPPSGA